MTGRLARQAAHQLIALCESMQAEHPTRKAREIATARFEAACQTAAYMAGIGSGAAVWMAVADAVERLGGRLNAAAVGIAARDARLDALIDAINQRLS